MEYIYVILENGAPYPEVFKSYKVAISAVKEKHRDYLEEQIKELYNLDMIESVLADINVPENIETDISKLYIKIYKLLLNNL